MISSINEESGSTKKLMLALKFPALIQLNIVALNGSAPLSSFTKSTTEKANATKTEAHPINAANPFTNFFPLNAISANPRSGRIGIKHIIAAVLILSNDSENQYQPTLSFYTSLLKSQGQQLLQLLQRP